jgi:hypothetical protein
VSDRDGRAQCPATANPRATEASSRTTASPIGLSGADLTGGCSADPTAGRCARDRHPHRFAPSPPPACRPCGCTTRATAPRRSPSPATRPLSGPSRAHLGPGRDRHRIPEGRFKCIFGFGLALREASAVIEGRGQVAVHGQAPEARSPVLPVTGGTGEFRNVRGRLRRHRGRRPPKRLDFTGCRTAPPWRARSWPFAATSHHPVAEPTTASRPQPGGRVDTGPRAPSAIRMLIRTDCAERSNRPVFSLICHLPSAPTGGSRLPRTARLCRIARDFARCI